MDDRSKFQVFRPAKRCIYCDNPGPYSKEHIIPLGLGGDQIIPRASCAECRDITSRFELTCQREMFFGMRVKHNMPTRRPDERPDRLPLIVNRDGVDVHLGYMTPEEFPVGALGFLLPEAGILRGVERKTVIDKLPFWFGLKGKPTDYPDGMRLGTANPFAFEQLISKIAHAFCIANYGFTSFKPILRDFIRGKEESGFYYVGGSMEVPPIDNGGLHKMRTYTEKRNGIEYLMMEVRLFCCLGAPTYFAVVGEV